MAHLSKYLGSGDRHPSAAAAGAALSLIVGRYFCQKSHKTIPAAIATTKAITRGDSVARFSNAGPGHKPKTPQPEQNSNDPITSGRSMPILGGQTLCVARTGRSRRFANM